MRIDNHNQLIRIDKRRNSLVSSSHYPPTARNLSHRNGSAPPTEYSSGNETVEKDHSLITNRTTGSEKISRNKNQRLDFQEIFDTGGIFYLINGKLLKLYIFRLHFSIPFYCSVLLAFWVFSFSRQSYC